MKRHLVGILVVAFALSLSSVARAQDDPTSWDAALTAQLTTDGVADPANATGEQIAAAVETLVINNPQLTAQDIGGLVRAAVARSPAAYEAIAVAAARPAAARGMGAADLEKIAAFAAEEDYLTVNYSALAGAISQATGVAVSGSEIVAKATQLAMAKFFGGGLFESGLANLIIEENPA